MKRLIFVFLFSLPALGIDGLHIGGHIGQVGLTGRTKAAPNSHGNAIGYGVELGVKTNAFIDALDLSSLLFSAELALGSASDFGFSLGIGPGFYFFKQGATTETNFGIHGSFGGDLWLSDALRAGIVARWNGVFSGTVGDNYWTIMLRVGYLIEF
jgi:hypothetical protein